jgi:hypothetical protein
MRTLPTMRLVCELLHSGARSNTVRALEREATQAMDKAHPQLYAVPAAQDTQGEVTLDGTEPQTLEILRAQLGCAQLRLNAALFALERAITEADVASEAVRRIQACIDELS